MLRLITWNIQSGRGCDGRVDLARIVRVARDIADFDVLCLQEVANNFPELPGLTDADQFAELQQLLPDYAGIAGFGTDVRAPDGRRRQFGNLILTRLPALQAFHHLLPWPADPDVPSMQRVAVEAVLQTPLGPLRVTTTHLEYYSAKQRAAQVERLRELQAEAASHARDVDHSRKEGGPFQNAVRPAAGVLTADFNFRPDDPLHARVQEQFAEATPRYIDSWHVAHGAEPQPPTLGVFDREHWPESYTCDFIFVSEDLAGRVRDVKVDSRTDASDHQPMLLVLA
jgi:endonuclease/exonuclease/phosphatase family metal-dependent hydrolase